MTSEVCCVYVLVGGWVWVRRREGLRMHKLRKHIYVWYAEVC